MKNFKIYNFEHVKLQKTCYFQVLQVQMTFGRFWRFSMKAPFSTDCAWHEKFLEENGKQIVWIWCIKHLLEITTRRFKGKIEGQEVMNLVTQYRNFLNASSKRSVILKQACIRIGYEYHVSPDIVKGRWWPSFFNSLQQYLYMHQVALAVFCGGSYQEQHNRLQLQEDGGDGRILESMSIAD